MAFCYIDDNGKEVRKGNIQYDMPNSAQKRLHLYLGNGLIGGCIDAFGNMADFAGGFSRSVLSHRYHYQKEEFGMEYIAPLLFQTCRVTFAGKKHALSDLKLLEYRQELDIYDGVLRTNCLFETKKDETLSLNIPLSLPPTWGRMNLPASIRKTTIAPLLRLPIA